MILSVLYRYTFRAVTVVSPELSSYKILFITFAFKFILPRITVIKALLNFKIPRSISILTLRTRKLDSYISHITVCKSSPISNCQIIKLYTKILSLTKNIITKSDNDRSKTRFRFTTVPDSLQTASYKF